MTLCMLDLGFRGSEVINLRLSDIDWQGRWLDVRATKTGQGRQLPIPNRVFAALRDYIGNARPTLTSFDKVFVRHPRGVGHPLSQCGLKAMLSAAYRRYHLKSCSLATDAWTRLTTIRGLIPKRCGA